MVDFNNMTPGTGSAADLKRAASEGKYSNHPVLGLLQSSNQNRDADGLGTVYHYDVAESDVAEVEQAVRGCAVVLDIGHMVRSKKLGQVDANGAEQYRVSFAAKDKKKRLTKEEREAKTAELQRKREERKAAKERREREAAEAKAKKDAEKAAKPARKTSTRR